MLRVLLIEDEKINRITLEKLLKHRGHTVQTCENGTDGLSAIQTAEWDVVLTDLRMPGADGMEILKAVKQETPHVHVLIMTAFATVENAVSALKQGAFDYLTKPFDPEELFHHLEAIERLNHLSAENTMLKESLAKAGAPSDLIGDSAPMRDLLEKIYMIADSEHTVLVEGASGTGKEKVAHAIQQLSQRSKNPYVKINCSALSETLFETEMFGHEKGAFTGAVKRTLGRFERAEGGTIFLDDIDDLSMRLQTKLLRVIQEGEIERVGGSEVIPVDVRIIAATKVDLGDLVKAGRFREDLFYRLNVIKLIVPPLADRASDVPILANYFLQKAGLQKTLSHDLLAYLTHYHWPGNVRELEHLIMQMSVFSRHAVLNMEDLPNHYLRTGAPDQSGKENQGNLTQRLDAMEAEILKTSMNQYANNQKKVADSLGIPRTTLRSKLLKHGLIHLAPDR